MLSGDGGADRFVFSGANGADTINGFESGIDQIDLSSYGVTFDDLDFTSIAGGFRIDGFGGGLIRVFGDAPVETDFLFG